MSAITRHVVPVSLKNGQCPSDARHFRGATREVFKYLKLLAANHGGFVFATKSAIARGCKNWSREQAAYSPRQVRRIIKQFQALNIMSPRQTVKIHGRTRKGWQLVDHQFWAEKCGDFCDVKAWAAYAEAASSEQDNDSDVTPHVTQHVTSAASQCGESSSVACFQ